MSKSHERSNFIWSIASLKRIEEETVFMLREGMPEMCV
jgi:hypothetical protein